MAGTSRIQATRRGTRAFRRDEGGASAVEFALLLPVLILLLFGSIELTHAIMAKRKVTLVASSTADLVTRVAKVNTTDMTSVFDAGKAVITPFDASKMSTVISSVVIDDTGKVAVAWSKAQNGTPRATGSGFSLPAALATPNSSVVVSEVNYNYTPVIGYVITGTLNLAETFYMRPRASQKVDWVP